MSEMTSEEAWALVGTLAHRDCVGCQMVEQGETRRVHHTHDEHEDAAQDYAAAEVRKAHVDPLTLLEALAKMGDDPIWRHIEVNYCPTSNTFTYLGIPSDGALIDFTRAEAARRMAE